MFTPNMKETIGQRIEKFLKEQSITQGELSRRSGVERPYINQLIHGKAKNVGIPIAQKLAKGLGISTSELIGEDVASTKQNEPSINEMKSVFSEVLEVYKRIETINIPIRGTVPAGSPSTEEENIEGYISIPKEDLGTSTKGIYALHVSGDSLIGDGINSGDLVIVEPHAAIVDGKIYIVRLGNEVVTRHVHRKTDKLILKPSNGNFQDMEVTEADILGRVILAGRWKKF